MFAMKRFRSKKPQLEKQPLSPAFYYSLMKRVCDVDTEVEVETDNLYQNDGQDVNLGFVMDLQTKTDKIHEKEDLLKRNQLLMRDDNKYKIYGYSDIDEIDFQVAVQRKRQYYKDGAISPQPQHQGQIFHKVNFGDVTKHAVPSNFVQKENFAKTPMRDINTVIINKLTEDYMVADLQYQVNLHNSLQMQLDEMILSQSEQQQITHYIINEEDCYTSNQTENQNDLNVIENVQHQQYSGMDFVQSKATKSPVLVRTYINQISPLKMNKTPIKALKLSPQSQPKQTQQFFITNQDSLYDIHEKIFDLKRSQIISPLHFVNDETAKKAGQSRIKFGNNNPITIKNHGV